jgi:hypothetical protein
MEKKNRECVGVTEGMRSPHTATRTIEPEPTYHSASLTTSFTRPYSSLNSASRSRTTRSRFVPLKSPLSAGEKYAGVRSPPLEGKTSTYARCRRLFGGWVWLELEASPVVSPRGDVWIQ